MSDIKKILILFAHPAFEKSQANRPLIHALVNLEHVTVQDLYEVYPDFMIDVSHEQQLLQEHDIIVFHHPFYWYSSPALLKEWQDLVLVNGFAFGEGGTALQGKIFLNVITTGGTKNAYQRSGIDHFTMRELLAPFEQTATFCGMTYLPPFVVHESRSEATRTQLPQLGQAYQKLIIALRDNQLDIQAVLQLEYSNQALGLLNK